MAGFEHALFVVLLLGFLLREQKNKHPIYLAAIIIGMVLVQFPPPVHISIPWELFLAAVLPWILCQYARNWLQATWRVPWKVGALWILSTMFLALIIATLGSLSWPLAIFFGIVATSLFWKMSSGEQTITPLEIIGPLSLVLLLAETSLTLDEAKLYLGDLFSGAGIGFGVALLAMLVNKRAPTLGNWVPWGLTYLAYWIALALEASPIAAALIGIVVYSEFHRFQLEGIKNNRNPGRSPAMIPFIVILVLFMFLTWQTHQPMTFSRWYEVMLSVISGILLALVGKRMGIAQFARWGTNALNALILGLYIFGILIIWPGGVQLEQVITWVAIGLAVFLLIISKVLLAALHDIDARRDERVDEKYPHF